LIEHDALPAFPRPQLGLGGNDQREHVHRAAGWCGGAGDRGLLWLDGNLHSRANLAVGTNFTAAISAGAKDLAGNALAAAYAWSFVTGSTTSKGPAPVGLGTADRRCRRQSRCGELRDWVFAGRGCEKGLCGKLRGA
jgi:hypothetical protein